MHVTDPTSPPSAMAAYGRRVSLNRPISSPAMWLAWVAEPPFPKQRIFFPPRTAATSASPAAPAASARIVALACTVRMFSAKWAAIMLRLSVVTFSLLCDLVLGPRSVEKLLKLVQCIGLHGAALPAHDAESERT